MGALRSAPRAGDKSSAAQREFGIDAILDSGESQLLQALHVEPCERLELEVGQRSAPPQRFGLPKQRRRAMNVVAVQRLSPGIDQALELVQVKLTRLDTQQVSGGRVVSRSSRPSAPASLVRRRAMLTLSVFSAAAAPWSGHSSSISRSRETTRFALSSSTASSARCLGPPISISVAVRWTSSGPRTRNSTRFIPRRVSHSWSRPRTLLSS